MAKVYIDLVGRNTNKSHWIDLEGESPESFEKYLNDLSDNDKLEIEVCDYDDCPKLSISELVKLNYLLYYGDIESDDIEKISMLGDYDASLDFDSIIEELDSVHLVADNESEMKDYLVDWFIECNPELENYRHYLDTDTIYREFYEIGDSYYKYNGSFWDVSNIV